MNLPKRCITNSKRCKNIHLLASGYFKFTPKGVNFYLKITLTGRSLLTQNRSTLGPLLLVLELALTEVSEKRPVTLKLKLSQLAKVSLRLVEGGEAKVLSDSYEGLEENAVVTVVKIDGDNVDVEDSHGVVHTVKKSDLKQNNEFSSTYSERFSKFVWIRTKSR